MQINATIEQQSGADEKRDATRWRIRLEVPGSLGDEHANVVIHDISTAGMLIESDSRLTIGQAISLSLPETDNIAAHIVWQNEPLFGCRFDQPLAQAALSAIRLRNPTNDRVTRTDANGAKTTEKLSDRLRRLRHEQRMSRTALSERTGISKTTLWSWETGKSSPRHGNMLILAEALGLTCQQLLQGEETPPFQQREEAVEQFVSPLSDIIDQAKDRIARAAGVGKEQISIRIDF